MNIKLSKHQQYALNNAINILQNHNQILIKGGAGTGKTTIINFLIKELLTTNLDNFKVSILAPTNKSVSVIRKKVSLDYNELYRRINSAFNRLVNPSTNRLSYNELYVKIRHFVYSMYDDDFIPEYFDGNLFDIIFSILYRRLYLDNDMGSSNKLFDRDEIIKFSTIHSALNYRKEVDEVLGKEVFRQLSIFGDDIFFGKNNFESEASKFLKGAGIVIIDEASMIGADLLKDLEGSTMGKKVIFIGDPLQIPPVKEYDTPVFTKFLGLPECVVELVDIVRQEVGNPIIGLSRNLGMVYRRKSLMVGDKGYDYSTDLEYVKRLLLEGYEIPDKVKFLSYENKYVDKMNEIIRGKIYSNPNKIELGEVLVMDSVPEDTTGSYYVNYELEVRTLSIKEDKFFYYYGRREEKKDKTDYRSELLNKKSGQFRLKYYLVNDDIKIIHEDSELYFKKILEGIISEIRATKEVIKNKKRFFNGDPYKDGTFWWSYYKLKNQFAEIKYNHALTIHKSQGSTYRMVIIHLNSFSGLDLDFRNRLLYTAITRASERIIFV